MLLVKKCQLFGLFRFGQNKTRNNAWRLCREKRNLFDYKKQNYSNSKKSHFSEGLRWLDTVFQGQYLPSLSINYVAINKVLEKLPPQLY